VWVCCLGGTFFPENGTRFVVQKPFKGATLAFKMPANPENVGQNNLFMNLEGGSDHEDC
jgi:hypothetical protein